MHDTSAAASPSTTHYSWQIGMAANQANAKLILQGTGPGANRVTVGNYTGSGTFGGFSQGSTIAERAHKYSSLAGALAGAGRAEAHYTTFTGLGVTGSDWLTANIGTGHRLILNIASSSTAPWLISSIQLPQPGYGGFLTHRFWHPAKQTASTSGPGQRYQAENGVLPILSLRALWS